MKKQIAFIILASLFIFSSCEALVNSVAFYPDTVNNIRPENLPDNVKEIFIKSGDGTNLQIYLLQHSKKAKKIIIYFHGNAGNAGHRLEEAAELFTTGCDVMILSYRGYGRSGGSPSEQGVFLDGYAVLDYAREKLGFSIENTYLYGRSLGTTVAVHIAAEFVPAGVILITPLTSARDVADFFRAGFLKYIAGSRFNSIEKISRMKSPLLVIHGDRDEIIPYSHGVRIYNNYTGVKKFVTIKNGRHNDLEHVDSVLYWKSVKDFIKK